KPPRGAAPGKPGSTSGRTGPADAGSCALLPVGGNPGRWQAGRRVLGEQLAQQRRDAGRAAGWWINMAGLEPPALAIGIGRLIQWSQRAQHGAAAGVDE